MSNSELLYIHLFRRAEEFRQAYRDLPGSKPPPDWPRYFLLCHSIELALKAYLSGQGTSESNLREYPRRHSLKTLITDATNLGLSIGAKARAEIEKLDEAHANFWPRYPNRDAGGTKPVFIVDQFEPYVDKLFDAVEMALFKSKARP
jgi:HEPN domain-containing protein